MQKLRSAVLLTAVIGKLSLEGPKPPFQGRPQNFFRGEQRQHFAYTFQVTDDAVQTDVHEAL